VDAVAVEMGVTLFKSLGAIIPGQIGVEEYGNKVMLDVIGIASNEVWFVVSLVRRARQLFWLAIAGVLFLIISKKNLIKRSKCPKKSYASRTNIHLSSAEWKSKVMS